MISMSRSLSFFDVVMSLNQPQEHAKLTINVFDLKKQVKEEFKANPGKLQKLQQALLYKRLDGTPWGERDEEVLDEYLDALPAKKINQLLQALKLEVINDFYGFPAQLNKIVKLLGKAVALYANWLNPNNGGLNAAIAKMVHQRKLSTDPSIPLTAEEASYFRQYSKIFTAAAKSNKEYNYLYRKIIKCATTEEQVLNGLLQHVKGLITQTQHIEAEMILAQIEPALLQGQRLKDLPNGGEELSLLVKANLTKAYALTNHTASDSDLGVTPVGRAVDIFQSVLQLVLDHEKRLEEDPLTKKERANMTHVCLLCKVKLLIFLVKTKAFAKEETLKPGVGLLDRWLDHLGREHATYFDFWLTTIPAGKAANSLDPIENCIENRSTLAEIIVMPYAEHDEVKPVFNQFNLVEQRPKLAETASAGVAVMADVAAYNMDGSPLPEACATLGALHREFVNTEHMVATFNAQLSESSSAEQCYTASLTEHQNIINDVRTQNLQQLVGKHLLHRSQLQTDIYALQKGIVQNVIDLIKLHMEAAKLSVSSAGACCNWAITEQERNVIWGHIQQTLNISDDNNQYITSVRESFNACLAGGGISVALQDRLIDSGSLGSIELLSKLRTLQRQQWHELKSMVTGVIAKYNLSLIMPEVSAAGGEPITGKHCFIG